MDTITELSRFYKALSDETRLKLITLLTRQKRGQALCVGRLAHELESSSANISQHLRILKDLGLVKSRRDGYRIHYFIDQEAFAKYQSWSKDLFGELQAD
jgi:DNA-binding transcriptional ArsR family regulator